MAIEIKLPELGDGIESGDVLQVLVNEGDVIQKDQGIIELETDKATVEVPSSHAGRVTKILVSSGDSVAIGAALLTLEAEGAGSPAPAAPPAAPAPPAQVEPPAPATTEPTAPVASEPAVSPAPAPTPPAPVPPAPPAAPPKVPEPVAATPAPAAPSKPTGDIAAGPAIRRLAREVGVELTQVTGTGEGGRITREDVLGLVRNGGGASTTTEADATPEESDGWGPIRTERMSKIRRTIAAKMHESWSTVPRVTNFDDADVTDLENFRQSSKADYAEKGIKLTSMPFVIKAVAMALSENPAINASLDPENDQIIYKQYVNVGIAVDTERGLVVPSLRNADELAIPEIARGLATLADKARSNSFAIEDLRGSTFTISNLGAIGGTYSTPIINVPEVAILLVGRARKLPVVIDDEVKVRLMMPLSLSYDHRLVDGGAAARFLNDVIGYLKAPSRLLLAP